MRGYAGVIVLRGDSVLLIREKDYYTHEPIWSLPSGAIEEGESPAVAAARELAEESGHVIDAADLELICIATVEHESQALSTSWTFTANAGNSILNPIDPDESVIDAQWVDRAQAIEHLSPHQDPKHVPAVQFLKSGQRGAHWTFELIDLAAPIPAFRWALPASSTAQQVRRR